MIKVQDFARECGVTDRQIHRLLSKYEDEVAGHFERQGQNGTWLDETACQILQSKMKKLPPAVSDQETVREVQRLEAENKRLNEQLGAQGILIGQMHIQISELQQFKIDTLEKQKALEDAKAQQARREQELDQREQTFAQELADVRNQALDEAQREFEEVAFQEIEKARQETADANDRADRLDRTLGKVQGERDAAELANKGLVDENHLLRQEIAQLRNRSVWDVLKERFTKGKK